MIPRRLSLYIARRFAMTLTLTLGGLALITALIDYVEIVRRHSDESEFTQLVAIRLVLMRLPDLLEVLLPFTFLFAALLGLFSLSRRLELVVARASGLSAWNFLRSPFLVALVLGALAAAGLNPLAVYLKGESEKVEAVMTGSVLHDAGGRWFRQDSPAGASIIQAGTVGEDGLILFGVTAFAFAASGEFREKVSAPRAEYRDKEWLFTDAQVISASTPPRLVPEYALPTELTRDELKRRVARPEDIPVWSLPAYIATAARTGLDPDPFRLAFHRIVNRPMFMLAMVMIAATVSLRLTRYGGTWKLLLSGAAAGFLLYVVTEIISDLGANGIIDPVLAAWLPPVMALTFGATALLHQEDG